jgi:ribosomal protein S2
MSFLASLPPVLQPKEEDIQMMLSAGVHTGTRNSDSQMEDYIWRRRNDGVHVINLGATWSKVCTIWWHVAELISLYVFFPRKLNTQAWT